MSLTTGNSSVIALVCQRLVSVDTGGDHESLQTGRSQPGEVVVGGCALPVQLGATLRRAGHDPELRIARESSA
jgi:hypothetical protein